MSDFTYEADKRTPGLETYEWDNTWWEHAPDTSLPRVLFIGDSISCGHRRMVTPLLDGKAWVDGFGTSKAVDNPWFIRSLELFVSQMPHCEMILFNNGLHGFHLSTEEYAKHYGRMVDELRALYLERVHTCLSQEDEVLVVGANELAVPVVDTDGNEICDKGSPEQQGYNN